MTQDEIGLIIRVAAVAYSVGGFFAARVIADSNIPMAGVFIWPVILMIKIWRALVFVWREK